MRICLYILPLLIPLLGISQEKRPIKEITILKETPRGKFKAPRRTLVAKIKCDGGSITEYDVKENRDMKSAAPYLPNDPYTLSTSIEQILLTVQDTSIYKVEFDDKGRITSANEKEEDTETEEFLQQTTKIYRLYWSFQYDSAGTVVRAGTSYRGLRGGGSARYYDSDGLEIKREIWHPRGFITSTEITAYRNGLPATKTYYFRGGMLVEKLVYYYAFY